MKYKCLLSEKVETHTHKAKMKLMKTQRMSNQGHVENGRQEAIRELQKAIDMIQKSIDNDSQYKPF